MASYKISEAARLLGVSDDTVRRWIDAGTLPTTGFLWIGTLVGVVVIVGALTFFPAMSLGPIVEHVFMGDGIGFPAP